ncbi:arginase [Octadecabacter temperatus]|uniref:Arginase n=1 Tax=Octadecabacter temperatus TaxID=1458307 RepID=A0A0K0Y5G0_9RHOB|nr:arginase [Octadecabacter temperatus]AKS46072.1 Arginase [Octadecabacter temperatus]SIO06896.1 arginase [Octadecabacter temperatus]
MTPQDILLIGAPVDSGKDRKGCIMGPDAYRTARLAETLVELGHNVSDLGNLTAENTDISEHDHLVALPQTVGWTRTLQEAAKDAAPKGLPIFLGGDHSLALGTVTGIADHAADVGRPLFVLWLDAHSDFHTPQSTASGNLHGTPTAYFTGRTGFDAFPAVNNPVPTENVCMIGLRSVDPAEHAALADTNVSIADMRAIDEGGIRAPLAEFLAKVEAANGLLHVSLDVDFLDPDIAPAVGTTVPGGATLREAHLVMEMLHDSQRVTSLDLVELNPFMDERGKTASLMVDLTASLMGRRVFDRPTRAFT